MQREDSRNWNLTPYWTDEEWKHAYKLFLANSPLETINKELSYRCRRDPWVDHGFNIYTKFPTDLNYYKDIDKRAILLVIARSRKMEWYDWDRLCQDTVDSQDLDFRDKLMVNSVMFQLCEHYPQNPFDD